MERSSEEALKPLARKARKHLDRHLKDGDTIRFCIQGVSSQAIVALQDRMLVIKPGWEAAASFGARVTSFYYRDVTGIEINTGLMMGVIEINSPAYQGTGTKDYWSTRKDHDPRRATNCIPTTKGDLKKLKPSLDELERLVREAKEGGRRPANNGGIVAELAKLAELRDSGVLTEEEFGRAKNRILDS
ncbi:MAG: SHOCT domain-containing protein [Actinomycetota bacterium]|nr:SHOCT domain-containing protein [Actinomycetota bacterium]